MAIDEKLIVEEYSREIFRSISPEKGQALLLFRESEQLDLGKDWPEGESSYTGVVFEKGKEYTVEGIMIRCQDLGGTSERVNLRVCNSISFYFNEEEIICPVGNKVITNSYAYFDVLDQVGGTIGRKITFEKDVFATFYRVPTGNKIYRFVDYECVLGDDEAGNVTVLYPTFGLAYENSDYNPVFNNVTGSVLNTYAKEVEVFRKQETGGSYKSHYSYSREMLTVPAEIPDSFYTSLQVLSGRILGAKNGLVGHYIGHKSAYSTENLNAAKTTEEDTGKVREKDLPFFILQGFTGSVYPAGTRDDALEVVNLNEMILENLLYTPTASYAGVERTSSMMFTDRARIDVPHLTHTEYKNRRAGLTFTGSRNYEIVEDNLPRYGTILYRVSSSVERLPNVKVYVPDLGAALKTDDYGIVVDVLPVHYTASVGDQVAE